jgi:hypothetical protein
MISIKEQLPLDNQMCEVRVLSYMKPHPGSWRFVRCSDGTFHWDNLIDEVLQETEVTHWKEYEEN